MTNRPEAKHLDSLGQFKTFWILFYFPKGTLHCFGITNLFLWKKSQYYGNHFSIKKHEQKILEQQ